MILVLKLLSSVKEQLKAVEAENVDLQVWKIILHKHDFSIFEFLRKCTIYPIDFVKFYHFKLIYLTLHNLPI